MDAPLPACFCAVVAVRLAVVAPPVHRVRKKNFAGETNEQALATGQKQASKESVEEY